VAKPQAQTLLAMTILPHQFGQCWINRRKAVGGKGGWAGKRRKQQGNDQFSQLRVRSSSGTQVKIH